MISFVKERSLSKSNLNNSLKKNSKSTEKNLKNYLTNPLNNFIEESKKMNLQNKNLLKTLKVSKTKLKIFNMISNKNNNNNIIYNTIKQNLFKTKFKENTVGNSFDNEKHLKTYKINNKFIKIYN